MSRPPDHAMPASGNEPRAKDDALARELRGFGPIALLAFVLIYLGNSLFAPLSALLVLLWAWWSGTPWRDIGFGRPRSWAVALLGGILFGIAFKLLMKTVVMPLLGAPPTNAAFSYLIGNTAALPAAIYLMVVTAGFGEETFFRGFLFERLGRLFGAAPARRAAIVAVTALWFGLEHVAVQGLAGFQQATIVGLAFGTIYAAIGRLWFLIAAHAAFDLTALAIIYLDLERDAAAFFIG
ncbi:MAG: CPBP family intramembrane glutamic endopeptidase [Allosphingosinicella sp.]